MARKATFKTRQRRKLKEGPEGVVILLGTKQQQRRTGKGVFEVNRRALAKGLGVETDLHKIQRRGLKNSMTISLGVATEFGFDLDVRKLVRGYIQIPLAIHFRDQLLRGRKPTSEHKHPDIKESTARHWKRSRKGYGVRTGWMAHNWLVFPVKGNQFVASAILKPNGADYRNQMITWALRKGIDFQGVTGSAFKLIQKGFNEWMGDMMATRSGVETPKKVDTETGGPLTQFIGGPHQGAPSDTRKFR